MFLLICGNQAFCTSHRIHLYSHCQLIYQNINCKAVFLFFLSKATIDYLNLQSWVSASPLLAKLYRSFLGFFGEAITLLSYKCIIALRNSLNARCEPSGDFEYIKNQRICIFLKKKSVLVCASHQRIEVRNSPKYVLHESLSVPSRKQCVLRSPSKTSPSFDIDIWHQPLSLPQLFYLWLSHRSQQNRAFRLLSELRISWKQKLFSTTKKNIHSRSYVFVYGISRVILLYSQLQYSKRILTEKEHVALGCVKMLPW